MGFLSTLVACGLIAYLHQFRYGLAATNMSDQVSWGAYIANFTFVVGLAAAAVIVVIPGYIYKRESLREVVFIGECLAIAAVVMCVLFVMVDLGNPQRGWHLMPGLGILNFPTSMLAWDVVVLNVYLVLNAALVLMTLFFQYSRRAKPKRLFKGILYVSMVWAISIHTVTAFLYLGLGARPFWNTGLLAPRFLISAFVSGPAFLIIALQVIRRVTGYHIKDETIRQLGGIIAVTALVNTFLFFVEMFKEFYTQSIHVASVQYMLFGLHGHSMIVPYVWTAIALNLIATVVFLTPALARRFTILNIACVLIFISVWIEKGMALIVPGFLPNPLGEIAEYTPSITEIFVCAGIAAAGMLVFSAAVKVSVAIESGHLVRRRDPWEIAAARARATVVIVRPDPVALLHTARATLPRGPRAVEMLRRFRDRAVELVLPRGVLRWEDYVHFGRNEPPWQTSALVRLASLPRDSKGREGG